MHFRISQKRSTCVESTRIGAVMMLMKLALSKIFNYFIICGTYVI